jgi:hypothetical protein
MRSTNSSPERWNLLPLPEKPGPNERVRRWDIVIISFLTFLVIGVFVAAIATGLELDMSAADKIPLRVDKDPAPVNLAEFKNGYAPVIDPALPAVVNSRPRRWLSSRIIFLDYSAILFSGSSSEINLTANSTGPRPNVSTASARELW